MKFTFRKQEGDAIATRRRAFVPWMGFNLEFSIERRIQLPVNAPEKLVMDIETYNALVDMQAKMLGASAWYQRLN